MFFKQYSTLKIILDNYKTARTKHHITGIYDFRRVELYSMHLVQLTNVLLNTQLQLFPFHFLNFLIVEFVPVAGTSVLHMGNVVA